MAAARPSSIVGFLIVGALLVIGVLGAARLADPCIGPSCHREAASGVAGDEARHGQFDCLHTPCHASATDAVGVMAVAAAVPVERPADPDRAWALRQPSDADRSAMLSSGLFRPPRAGA